MRTLSPRDFVLSHTRLRRAPFVPELRLHLSDDALEVWETTQAAIDGGELPPPFWAFVWAGGQAVARYVLDNPGLVAGRPVVDVATGSGLVAVAAAMSGAASVAAYDIDELAVEAARLNAAANDVSVVARCGDVRDLEVDAGTVVTVGDVFYDERIAATMLAELTRLAEAGAEVVVGDPHRAYLPRAVLEPLAEYDVDVEAELEDAPVKPTVVALLRPTGAT